MKILAIVKESYSGKEEAANDIWRIKRPLQELSKHTDWQIDYQSWLIRDGEKYDDPVDFLRNHAEAEVDHLGQYDAIYLTYFLSPHLYTLLWATNKKYGTKFIIDLDDDPYDIEPSNPFWLTAGWKGGLHLQRVSEIAPYLSTTNKHLAKKLREHSEVNSQVFVIPNYIPEQYKEYEPDNGDIIRVGYFGGASHYTDLHETGILPAIRQVLEENPNVRFRCVGQPIDEYLPPKQTDSLEIAEGELWARDRFPELHYDIALAPIRDTEFNKHKSNIKWQESTRMGAAFICTNYGPYKSLKDGTAWKVPNTQQAWYIAIKALVDDEKKRKQFVADSRRELINWKLEYNWHKYKEMFETVINK
jgi:hypothetical protein